MASDNHRSAAEIEREIEAERSSLTQTLDEIQDRLSFEYLSNDLMGRVRDNSGDIGRSVARSVKENPIPLAITAVGLAWLMVGQGRTQSLTRGRFSRRGGHGHDYDDDQDELVYSSRRSSLQPSRGFRDEYPEGDRDLYSPAGEPYETTGRRPIYDASGRPINEDVHEEGSSRWDRAKGAASGTGHAVGERLRSSRDAAASSASTARDRASAGLSSGSEAAGSGYRSGRDAAYRGAGRVRAGLSRTAAEAQHRARGAYASAAELRERITHGLEGMGEDARRRIVAARTRAYEAQLRAEYYARRGRDKAGDLYEDQPLVAGALALAFGAAVGGLLPRTHREDEAFGGYRDQVFEEAERVYREERSKFESVARETASEARNIARETAEEVKDDLREAANRTGETARAKLSEAEQRTKEAADRVADTAKSEAENKNLGQR